MDNGTSSSAAGQHVLESVDKECSQDQDAKRKSEITNLEVEESGTATVYYFGCCCCHPRWLQVLANAKVYTLILSLFILVEGAVASGLTSTVISTLERRYSFSSTAAGFIASTFDITVILLVVFVSYFGGRGHKARWLGIGCVLQGIGCLVFASPQFFFFNNSSPEASNTRFQVCLLERNTTNTECEATNGVAYAVLLVGQILLGAGAAPLFTLGITYLDDLVHPHYISLHLGILYTLQVLGPAVGLGLGGALLSIYVDPWVRTNLDQTDTAYLGAWWIGFIITGILSLIIAVPFFMYPRQLSDADEVAKARKEEMAKKGEWIPPKNAKLKEVIKDFFHQLKQLLTNITFLLNVGAVATTALSVIGLVTFVPKFIENQFYFPASQANLIVGGTAIVTATVGACTGALLLFMIKDPVTKGRKAALLVFIMGAISAPFSLGYLAHCSTLEIVGVTARNTSGINSLSCVAQCNCNTSQYEPVCGADGFTYASPCHAGCTTRNLTDPGNALFSECGCVLEAMLADRNSSQSGIGTPAEAFNGICNSDRRCSLLPAFLIPIGIALILQYSRAVPLVYLNIRCVDNEQRHLALGVASFIVRLLGSIPGPLIAGALFDSSCLLRNIQQEECGLIGNCLLFDNFLLSVYSMALCISGLGVSAVFSFLTWLSYPKSKVTQ